MQKRNKKQNAACLPAWLCVTDSIDAPNLHKNSDGKNKKSTVAATGRESDRDVSQAAFFFSL